MKSLVLGLLALIASAPSAHAAPSAAQAAQALSDLATTLYEATKDPARDEVMGAMEDFWLALQAEKRGDSTVHVDGGHYHRLRNDFEQRYRTRLQKLAVTFAALFPDDVEHNFPIGETQFVAFKYTSPFHWLIDRGYLIVLPNGGNDDNFNLVDVNAYIKRYLPEVSWRVYRAVTDAIAADPVFLKLDIESAAAYDSAIASRKPGASPANFSRLVEAREAFVGKYLDVFVNMHTGFSTAYSGAPMLETKFSDDGESLHFVDRTGSDLVGPALDWDQAEVAISPVLHGERGSKPYRPFTVVAQEVLKKSDACTTYMKKYSK